MDAFELEKRAEADLIWRTDPPTHETMALATIDCGDHRYTAWMMVWPSVYEDHKRGIIAWMPILHCYRMPEIWHPVAAGLPSEAGEYLCCYKPMHDEDLERCISRCEFDPGGECLDPEIIAWMPVPEVYDGEEVL